MSQGNISEDISGSFVRSLFSRTFVAHSSAEQITLYKYRYLYIKVQKGTLDLRGENNIKHERVKGAGSGREGEGGSVN